MKKILFFLFLVGFLGVNSYSQIKDGTITAVNYIVLNEDTMYIDPITSADGQFMRKISGKWTNSEYTGVGYDSLKFNTSTGYLVDYRGGSPYDSVLIRFFDIFLPAGADRVIKIVPATGGQQGNDLTVVAGANDDGIGGGDLNLRGGGEIDEFGHVRIGVNDIGSYVYILDTLDMGNKGIKNLKDGVALSDAATVGQLIGLPKSKFKISLPNAGSVAARIAGASSGTDYEEGWTLEVGDYATDIKITHNLGLRIASVTVFSVSGATEQLLIGSNAYTGVYSTSDNVFYIKSLASLPTAIKIYLNFE